MTVLTGFMFLVTTAHNSFRSEKARNIETFWNKKNQELKVLN